MNLLQLWDKKEFKEMSTSSEVEENEVVKKLKMRKENSMKKRKYTDSHTLESTECQNEEEMKGLIMVNSFNDDDEVVDKSNNVHFQRFKKWLIEDVQLPQYLHKFCKAEMDDVRMVYRKYIDEMELQKMGIDKKCHRRLILDEIETFYKLHQEFIVFLDKYESLRGYKKILKQNAILTESDLINAIPNQQELQKLFKLPPNDKKIAKIWNILHPTQSRFELQLNEFKNQQKSVLNAFNDIDKYIQFGQSLKMSLSSCKSDDSEAILIQNQLNPMIHNLVSRLNHYYSISQQLLPQISMPSHHPQMLYVK